MTGPIDGLSGSPSSGTCSPPGSPEPALSEPFSSRDSRSSHSQSSPCGTFDDARFPSDTVQSLPLAPTRSRGPRCTCSSLASSFVYAHSSRSFVAKAPPFLFVPSASARRSLLRALVVITGRHTLYRYSTSTPRTARLLVSSAHDRCQVLLGSAAARARRFPDVHMTSRLHLSSSIAVS
ncbi:hypothetical protein BV20DRAFT_553852 [Pilatotrama ljubarskyi]|nr:hypothetical protein BV20DRAFT_553852 [Pilatotrama ljubarskyi]